MKTKFKIGDKVKVIIKRYSFDPTVGIINKITHNFEGIYYTLTIEECSEKYYIGQKDWVYREKELAPVKITNWKKRIQNEN